MQHFGLLGKKLGHSYSPEIHRMLAGYDYRLYEKDESEVESFLKSGETDGLNVTIPYKKAVLPFLDEVSEEVKETGSVNVIVRRKDGTLYGDNTDVYGFEKLVLHSGIPVRGRKTLVLGNGGAAPSVCLALKKLGAVPVIISRRGEENYTNLDKHRDAKMIVNTTPLGMYPENGKSAVDLSAFPELEGVFDIVYNPSVTRLLLDAEKRNIPHANGLYMLVAQAKKAAEIFTGSTIDDKKIEEINECLSKAMKNVILIGMPGSGKTTVSSLLGKETGREVIDTDEKIAEKVGMPVPDYIVKYGEKAFRDAEAEVISDAGRLSGKIISTGGGCILREENYDSLHQNGTIFWITRDITKLPCDGRPLSDPEKMNQMYEIRKPKYAYFCDEMVDNDGNLRDTVRQIMEKMK